MPQAPIENWFEKAVDNLKSYGTAVGKWFTNPAGFTMDVNGGVMEPVSQWGTSTLRNTVLGTVSLVFGNWQYLIFTVLGIIAAVWVWRRIK